MCLLCFFSQWIWLMGRFLNFVCNFQVELEFRVRSDNLEIHLVVDERG